MQITQKMIEKGVSKAVELGVLPRKSLAEDIATNNELVFEILQAALKDALPETDSAEPEAQHNQQEQAEEDGKVRKTRRPSGG